MSNWETHLKIQNRIQEKDKVRREKLAGYFFDISKLSFAGLVIGIIVPLFSNVDDLKIWGAATLGILLTILAATLANKIQNNMDVLIFVYAVGVAIVGGIYAWTFTKAGKKWLAKL